MAVARAIPGKRSVMAAGAHRPGPRPFQVIVTCPGADGTGAHPLTCIGTHTS